MSPGGDSPGRLPVEYVAEAALWAAGAESDGDAEPDATRPGAASPNGEAAAGPARRPAAASPAAPAADGRPLLDSPSTSASATLSNSSSIASEKNDEPKATGVAAELVSKLAPGPA